MSPFNFLATFRLLTVLELGHGQGGFKLVY